MKKEFKYILIGMFIFFFIFSIFNVVASFIRINRTVYIKTIDEYTKNVTKIKEEINNLEEGSCKVSFTNMLNRINDTYLKENSTLKEYYNTYFNNDETFMNYYSDVLEECELDEDAAIYIDALASMEYPNKIKEEYELRYEFKLSDTYSRDSINKTNDETGTYLNKTLELRVIKLLLDEVTNE